MPPMTSSNAILDEQGLRLLKLLISILPKVNPNNPRTFITYKQVHERLNLPQLSEKWGRSLQHQGLNSLANWLRATDKPGIPGLIIDKLKLTPGSGYYELFGKKPDDFEWWKEEILKSKDFDWSDYSGDADSPEEKLDGAGWSREELHASVVAYLEMQKLEWAKTPFTKKKYYDDLSSKFRRTAKSFEFRMQNISYVLSLLGRDWLTGLKPAKNVGVNVATQIEELIAEVEGKSFVPKVAFEMEVRESLEKDQLPLPQGNRVPKTTTSTVTIYERDPTVKAWVLRQANGVCECCNQKAPFMGSNGLPFLEVHHIRKLADGGSDCASNAVAICPNCHRELHYGGQAKEVVERLYAAHHRLIRE